LQICSCSEFNEAYSAFSIRTYDCLDPEETEFVIDHREFAMKVKQLEQRMSLIVEQAFKDATTPAAFLTVRFLLHLRFLNDVYDFIVLFQFVGD